MMAGSRLYLPLFGITLILTISSLSYWISSKKDIPNSILWGTVLLLIWGIYYVIVRKRK